MPTQSVTFLPLLSSVDIHVFNDIDTKSLLYFGPVGSFASTLETRWKGDDTLGLARLTRCFVSVEARYIGTGEAILRDEIEMSTAVNAFDDGERQIFDTLINQGMDLSIRVTSNFSKHAKFEGCYPVFEVPPW